MYLRQHKTPTGRDRMSLSTARARRSFIGSASMRTADLHETESLMRTPAPDGRPPRLPLSLHR
jgi:hypothetical protein